MKKLMFFCCFYIFYLLNIYACDMVLMVSRNNKPLDSAEVRRILISLRARGNFYNPHGWGIVAFDKQGVPIPGYEYIFRNNRWTKRIDPVRYSSNIRAMNDDNYLDAIEQVISKEPYLVMGHVRQATTGSNNIADPHPYVYQNEQGRYYAFAHNGTFPYTLYQKANDYVLQSTSDPNFAFSMTGWRHGIDSGYWFRFILSQLHEKEWKMAYVMQDLLIDKYDFFEVDGNNNPLDWCANFFISDGIQGYAFRRIKSNDYVQNVHKILSNVNDLNETYHLSSTFNIQDNQQMMLSGTDGTTNCYLPSMQYYAAGSYFQHLYVASESQEQTKLRFLRKCFYPRNARIFWSWLSYPFSRNFTDLPGTPNKILTSANNTYAVKRADNQWRFYGSLNNVVQKLNGIKARILNSNINENISNIENISFSLPMNETIRLYQYRNNWIAYWLMNQQSVQQALGPYLHQIDKVYSDTWAYDSRSMINGDQSMEFGKMYIITLKPGNGDIINFTWSNYQGTGDRASVFESPECFTPNYREEYKVITIESIHGYEDIDEIAIFDKDKCIGASKLKTFPIQILVYDQESRSADLCFKLVDKEKRLYENPLVYEIDLLSREMKRTVLNRDKINFNQIILKRGDFEDQNNSQIEISKVKVFPNPSKDIVNIQFDLKSSGIVHIEIYNIKGQKVGDLNQKSLNKGEHHFYWNSKSTDYAHLASGQYFLRISSGSNIINKKVQIIK